MELLLAILVWLRIASPGMQITSSDYEQLVQSNSTLIQQVVSDTSLSQQAVAAYNEGTRLVVIDPISR